MKKSNISILCFALMLFVLNTISAQEKKTFYYFTTATAFIDGEGKKAIVTDVETTNCFEKQYSYVETSIENQLGDYLKAEYSNWHKYSKTALMYLTREKAETARRKFIGDKKNSGYTVIKDIYFKYYCKD